jgi:hypothetical protein
MQSLKVCLMTLVMALTLASSVLSASPEDLAEKCRQRCESQGLTGMKLRQCVARCNKIENCGPAYQSCVKGAKTDKQKQACQEAYRKCKGE